MFELTAPTAVFIMCVVTYLTRVGGLVFMSWFAITPRITNVLDALAGSTMVALILPSALSGDRAGVITIAVAATVMMVTKNAMAAMICGVAAAALFRAVL